MKKLIIVGGGIAGLTAGVYARQSGFDTTIFESHTIPGGNCTSWNRKGYHFEGAMHWLTGSSPEQPLNKLWRNVGALNDDVPIHLREKFYSYEWEGKWVHLYRDIDKLCAQFLKLSPEDEKAIARLKKDVSQMSKLKMPITDIKGVKVKEPSKMEGMMGMLTILPRLSALGKMTVGEYAAQFKHPVIREMLSNVTGPDFSAVAMVSTIATWATGDGGFPKGGSLAMAKRMADRFTALGGTLRLGTRVDKVIVENGQAVGVMVGDERQDVDAVIVASDIFTADKFFDKPLDEPWLPRLREIAKPMLCTFLSLGFAADLSPLPEAITFKPYAPINIGGIEYNSLALEHYAGYEGFAPEGCTAATAFFGDDSYDFWKAARENGTYQAEKQKLAEAYIDRLTRRFPNLEGKIAVWDVATPLTYERYCGTYRGSWMSNSGLELGNNYPLNSASVRGLYFAGQRMLPPGGMPGAAMTGRGAVQHVCRDTDTVFQGNL